MSAAPWWADDWVTVTEHAAERWHQRTDAPGFGPRAAWIHGRPVNDHDYPNADEVRTHGRAGVDLLRVGGVLVTVLPTAWRHDDEATAVGEVRA